MKKIDASKLPAVLTDEIIEMILPMLQVPNSGWTEFKQNLTDEQLHQIYVANEKDLRTKREAKMATATQEEKDAMMRGSMLHVARDHWFVTIFDEYDLVNGTGHYPYLSLEQIRVSTPANYAYDTIELRRNYMTGNERFTFFTEGSPFTMCYPAKIVVDKLEFSSSLHYIVYKKAEALLDREAMKKVLLITDQEVLRRTSRELRYFEKQIWNMLLKNNLLTGIREKFLQHPSLMEELKSTQGTTLALADAGDGKWGIGLDLANAGSGERKNWKGKNLLGELLTEIRKEFMGGY